MFVLAVDSDQIFLHMLINHLLICGVNTFEVASSGRAAWDKISKTVFDIALINFCLPDIPGLQLASELKNRKPDSKILIVINDHHQSSLKSSGLEELAHPTILKSELLRRLPQLLSEKN